LQRQQAVLEAKLQQPVQDRAWIATLPASALPANTAATESQQQLQQSNFPSAVGNDTKKSSGDGALLAQRAKRQHEERMARENGGMTTKAMRDLERIKKQKVYSHVQLTIQFSDGCKLSGKFLPKETVATVRDAIVQECLVLHGLERDFDLYVAPPRRLLNLTSTLTEEGLVPAAKIFVSWKGGSTPDKNAPVGSYLEPRLFGGAASRTSLFPSAQPIVGSASTNNNNSQDGSSEGGDKKEKKGSKEEDLLKRMMGGSRGLGGGGGGSKSSAKDKDAKPSGGKPKWFK
jgi:hypothetical protein